MPFRDEEDYAEKKQQAAHDVISILHEISNLLNTDLTRRQITLCASLIENGVNPEALAAAIKDIRKDVLPAPSRGGRE
ncbi:hypothetical protein BO70DRAFT_396596 [Aspergillus heteromorphus CBS 117.55]|uniref:Mitotic-spindle organizing protein 1 n=1 Tax=Aspergillus heteromorphus CBS 117.55 TaxID=1448321 RepID=A0A317W975_9EURO|nr:uncharacterized protein BO70DRAFT_396596 [Aspergillus heteromorphus CBS 117.55]PWY81812.1 hypothetical protein BO70DRAFT_396596 [Aspergillus heteromorphus CBS 117.55]